MQSNRKIFKYHLTCTRVLSISIVGIWEILGHSEPFSFLQFSDRCGHLLIDNSFNLERRWMAVELGIYLRFLQPVIQRDWREERLANHSGNASSNSSPSKLIIHDDSRAVRCWSWCGTLFSLSHPYISRDSRDPLKCWIDFKTPAGKASSEKPPPCYIKLNPSRRSRKAATSCHRPAASRQPPATSHQPPAVCRHSRLHTWRLNFLVLNSCINSKLSLCY